MKRSKSNDEANSDQPAPFMFVNRNPKYRKANSDFLTRKFRMEFDKLTTVRPLCKSKINLPPRPPELAKYTRKKPKIDPRKSRKRSEFCPFDILKAFPHIVFP